MLLIGVVVIIGSCLPFSVGLPPCVCTRRFSPVCGSDGNTYSNQCLLECAATKNPDITLQRSGKCDSRKKRDEPLCLCNANHLPVCGTDGETYANECLLDCQKEQTNVELKHQGPCRGKREEPLCACPLDYSPVCGTDGTEQQTYGNECDLECTKRTKSVEFLHDGPCRVKREEPICVCTDDYRPVCGTDGVKQQTYGNKCDLECTQMTTPVKFLHDGPCREKREEPICACPFNYSPVCGTDGAQQQTYSNECDLECTQKTKSVKFLHEGPCRVKREEIQVAPGPICLCTADLKPVCASNGLTYDNPCMFNCAKESSTLNEIHIEHEGVCPPKPAVVGGGNPACSCPKIEKPVCASDGNTYTNECIMECEGKELSVIRSGRC